MKGLVAVVLVVVFCLVGCSSAKPTRQLTRVVKDSTVTEINYVKRDTFITIPGDTLRFKLPATEITEKPIIRTRNNTTAIISRNGNDIDFQCITDSLSLRLELMDKHIKELHSIIDTSTETITETEYKTPWYSKALNVIAIGFLLFIAGKMAWKRII